MDIFQGIIIGIVQGLTEFLPVSSSAHLIFIQNILGVESSLAFDTFLHLGSLLAVLIYFRADIYKMIRAWLLSIGDILQHRFREGFYSDPYKRLAWYVILATIPVGIAGVFLESHVDALFAGALYVPGFFLFVTGTILYLSQRMASGQIDMSHMGWFQSLFMGLGQACAKGICSKIQFHIINTGNFWRIYVAAKRYRTIIRHRWCCCYFRFYCSIHFRIFGN